MRRQHAGRVLQRTLALSGEDSHTAMMMRGLLIPPGDLEIDLHKMEAFLFLGPQKRLLSSPPPCQVLEATL